MFVHLFEKLQMLNTFDAKDEIGLCYDLMLGAAHSLSKIDTSTSFEKREIYFDASKRKQLMKEFCNSFDENSNQNWFDGFHFSNAGHRIIWIQGRLHAILWKCPVCDQDNGKLQFQSLEKVVASHLAISHGIALQDFKDIWQTIYPEGDEGPSKKLRDLFNNQKHDTLGMDHILIEKQLGKESLKTVVMAFFEVIRLYHFLYLLKLTNSLSGGCLAEIKSFK